MLVSHLRQSNQMHSCYLNNPSGPQESQLNDASGSEKTEHNNQEAWSKLHWKAPAQQDRDLSISEHEFCQKFDQRAMTFLQNSLLRACKQVCVGSIDPQVIIETICKEPKTLKLRVYDNTRFYQTFFDFVCLVYDEFDENEITSLVTPYFQGSAFRTHFDNSNVAEIWNTILSMVEIKIVDVVFNRFKESLKKIFKDAPDGFVENVLKNITNPKLLQWKPHYDPSKRPEYYVCGYCLNEFKYFKCETFSNALFLGKKTQHEDAQFLIQKLGDAMHCIKWIHLQAAGEAKADPAKVSEDILDLLCCFNGLQ